MQFRQFFYKLLFNRSVVQYIMNCMQLNDYKSCSRVNSCDKLMILLMFREKTSLSAFAMYARKVQYNGYQTVIYENYQ